MERILVFRSGAVGDFILTLPVFAALRRRWPAARIEIVGRPEIACLAVEGGLADAATRYEDPMWSALFVDDLEPGPALKRKLGEQDLILSFTPDRGGGLARRLRAWSRARVIAHPPHPSGKHAGAHLLDALAEFGLAGASPAARLPTPASRRARAAAWLAERGLDPRRLVVLHPGSGSPRKCWPLSHFRSLVRALARSGDVQPAVSVGPAEAERGDDVRALQSEGAVLMEGLSLPELAGVLTHARAYVGNDSGITHLAAAVGAATVALFGPTDPRVWAPLGPRVRVLRGEPMARIAPAEALRLVRRFLRGEEG